MDGLGMIGVGRALGPQDGAGSRSRPEGKGLQLAAMYFVQVAALLLVSPRPLITCTSYIPMSSANQIPPSCRDAALRMRNHASAS